MSTSQASIIFLNTFLFGKGACCGSKPIPLRVPILGGKKRQSFLKKKLKKSRINGCESLLKFGSQWFFFLQIQRISEGNHWEGERMLERKVILGLKKKFFRETNWGDSESWALDNIFVIHVLIK